MTKEEVYEAYLLWNNDSPAVPLSCLFETPFANLDVFEDERRLVNRLFFLVPKVSRAALEVFLFFEESLFLKDESDDLLFLESSFHLL